MLVFLSNIVTENQNLKLLLSFTIYDMGYTHYLNYNFKSFGELEYNQRDKAYYPKSEEFWNKRRQFTDIVYNITVACREEGIDLGNGM